jgi:DNA gyrase/topoisomerase IV subunit A
VREGYRTGRGKVVMRAKCHFEDIDRGQRQAIVVDEIFFCLKKHLARLKMYSENNPGNVVIATGDTNQLACTHEPAR